MNTILQEWKKPGIDSRGMFRCWFPDAGADLDRVETGACMVIDGTINGKPLPPLNQRSGKVDLAGLVCVGENTLELTIATTLINRLRIEHPFFDGKGGMPGPPAGPEGVMVGTVSSKELEMENDYELPAAPMDMPTPRSAECHYGIYSVTVTPYHNL